MTEITLFSEIPLDSNRNLDENSENLVNKEDYLIPLKDNDLTSIFENKNTDNDSEIDFNDYYFLQKKINSNHEDSNENSLETKGKSNEEFPKNEEKNMSSLNQSGLFDSKSNNIDKLLFKNICVKNIEQNDNDKIIINNNSNNIDKLDNFKDKKRNIYKVIYSYNYNIYSPSESDKEIKKRIYEALNDNNCKNKKNILRKFNFENRRKRNKKRKNIFKRKQNSDNIRKKIKSRFLKSLKNAINEKLKSAGARYIFTLLPQKFVCNLSKKINRDVLNISLKELFSTNFCNIKKEKKADIKKYNHNIFVLKYLENNKDICEKSKFNIIKNMKYTEIFHEYFISKEFEKDISSLIQQKENDKYIKDYIIKARNFINFFAH